MKVTELSGALLDCWVACVLNPNEKVFHNQDGYTMRWHYKPKPYSTEWEHGGPILGQLINHGYIFMRTDVVGPVRCMNAFGAMDGSTVLESAMRAFVRDRFGAEVPDAV